MGAQILSIWIENDLIKRFKTLPGLGRAFFDEKMAKLAKTKKYKKTISL